MNSSNAEKARIEMANQQNRSDSNFEKNYLKTVILPVYFKADDLSSMATNDEENPNSISSPCEAAGDDVKNYQVEENEEYKADTTILL